MEPTSEYAEQQATFAALLRAFRLSAGIGQEVLAERARMSPQAVSALERGIRLRPYPATVANLADALGLNADDRKRFEQSAIRHRGRRGNGRATQRWNNNLPAQLTSLIGRESEVATLTKLLEQRRLVTVVGSGGLGKTCIALQVARALQGTSPDGEWFIELAPLGEARLIVSTMAKAMNLLLPQEGDPSAALVTAMRRLRVLIVLDNCEHLVDAVAAVVGELLANCPNVVILATSRRPLAISSEVTYRLPSLSVEDGIKLFASRAADAEPTFALSDENAPTIAEICRRIDGIPLAIELAAARVKILSPRQLRAHLDERFRVLTDGRRDALPRQQTLRALIDWSHDLLDKRQRTLFRRLGTFVNGFSLEGALAVGRGEDLEELDIFESLAALVDQSLVLMEPSGDAVRYRLLESTHMYALERLADADELEASARRHLRYLHDRFVHVRKRFERTAKSAELDDALAIELDNVRAALDRALGGPDALLAGELLAAIGWNWGKLELASEGLTRIHAFLPTLSERDPVLLARLWIVAALLAANSYRLEPGLEAATKAVAHARAGNNAQILAEALDVFSYGAARLGKYDKAEAALREAEEKTDISPALRLRMLQTRALMSWRRRDLGTAARLFGDLRKEHHSLGNTFDERIMTLNLAEVEHALGRTQRAIALVREVLSSLRTHSDRTLLIKALANLAGYLAAAGDTSVAGAAARDAIAVFAGHDPGSIRVGMAMEHLALTLALTGDLQCAANLAGYADARFTLMGFQRQYTESTTRDRLCALLRERLPPGELARLLADGAALTPESAVTLALDEPAFASSH